MKMHQAPKMQMALVGQMPISYISGYENPRSKTGPMYRQKLKTRLFKNRSPEKLAAAIAKRERKNAKRWNDNFECIMRQPIVSHCGWGRWCVNV